MGNNVKLESKSRSKLLAAFSGKSWKGKQLCFKVQEGTGQALMAAISLKSVFELLGPARVICLILTMSQLVRCNVTVTRCILFTGAWRVQNQDKSMQDDFKLALVQNWICKTELGCSSPSWHTLCNKDFPFSLVRFRSLSATLYRIKHWFSLD